MSFVVLVSLGYGFMSIVTYAIYALDKSAAREGRHRVPERTLHLLALLGGWPGALLAQRRLRHKCGKAPFLAVFRLTALVNVALLVWLCWPAGGSWHWPG